MKLIYGQLYKPTTLLERRKSSIKRQVSWATVPWEYKISANIDGFVGVIFLGYRTVHEGYISRFGYDEPAIFKKTKAVKAALVCYSSKANPVYVPVDSLLPV